jgi:hypothetical protein
MTVRMKPRAHISAATRRRLGGVLSDARLAGLLLAFGFAAALC